MATAFVPLALVGYVVAALLWWVVRLLGGGRLRVLATVALGVCVAGVLFHAALLVPAYAGRHGSGPAALTVLTSNLYLGEADTGDLVRIAAREHADVVVLEEVTPQEMERLGDLRTAYSYVAGGAAPWGYGTVVLSRYPLAEVSQLHVSKGAWQMRVAAPRPFWLVAVHTAEPLATYPDWAPDHAALLAAVRRLHGPLVVAGDFNATLDHGPMRRLLATGLSDAARSANAGWQPTWPANQATGQLEPLGLGLMTLDHVLFSRDWTAISASTHRVTGSDHRALVVRLARR
jgi:endonuclease/exonuclease/phosphatase (EEP) superfamily protein YafD